jgi:DNA ligase 1
MTKDFRPMLAPNEKVDLSQIKYPLLASTKLDGIRTIFMNGRMLSRSLKEIPNKQLQEKFQPLKDFSKKFNTILDGEMYGNGMSFQQITHFVMTQDLEGEELPNELKFNCFDCIYQEGKDVDFQVRYVYTRTVEKHFSDLMFCLEQEIVTRKEDVEELFEGALEGGFEGLILKNPKSKYKFGRATLKSGDMYKVKPFLTFDLRVIRIEERMENTSESFKNELGKSTKHSFKDSMIPTGIAATFVVMYNGMEQKVCLTGTEEFRREIWNNQNKYIGKMIEVKGMTLGSKDLIRHPTFMRFRLDKDVDK